MSRIKFLGSQLDVLTMAETLQVIAKYIEEGKIVQHVSLNASKVYLIDHNERLQRIVNQAEIVSADGSSIVLAGRFLGQKVPERVTGIELFLNVVKLAAKRGYRVFYLGATDAVVQRVAAKQQAQYPTLQVAGYRNGYFSDGEAVKIAKQIRASQADILFVGFSSPQKEFFIDQYKETMGVPFIMGVGGSFDVVAGKTKRAPRWMQKVGLEWFYRFLQEPRRMFKRYLLSNSYFIWKVLKERVRLKR
ncbi:beta-1,4-N-acetyl-mannosaminyltransferase [Listeria floridensis FSL S10-1187]|uniref:Beta-1,4-N-acetyl-mannosaminyltransferase n=1 Tax=Listeria floridensis FSL S10-1187 TaxID=1265817 RepID=A0ABN0RC28_9LIST|nr:WecB/TagA/CpsF family glycosyltransferase [Listeria floridensis]EUJ26122.1 beta-1,4-N-acetyl-mannosaminyltransferase [Listeria floridensis FSL S10-1187]